MLERSREVSKKLSYIEELLLGMFKVGTVTSVNEKEATVRVEFKDRERKVSWELPVLFLHTYADKLYWLPKEGELVVCLFPPGHRGFGVVIGSLYNREDKVPVEDRNKVRVDLEDGTRIEYDKRKHILKISVQGDILIEATGNVTIKGSRIDLNP